MWALKRVSVLSVAKISSLCMAAFGFIAGILFGIFSSNFAASIHLTKVSVLGIWVLSLIGIPLLFYICGFIGGLLFSFLYNFFSRHFRGFLVEYEEALP